MSKDIRQTFCLLVANLIIQWKFLSLVLLYDVLNKKSFHLFLFWKRLAPLQDVQKRGVVFGAKKNHCETECVVTLTVCVFLLL